MHNKGYRWKTVRSFLTETGEVQILLVGMLSSWRILNPENAANKNFNFVSA